MGSENGHRRRSLLFLLLGGDILLKDFNLAYESLICQIIDEIFEEHDISSACLKNRLIEIIKSSLADSIEGKKVGEGENDLRDFLEEQISFYMRIQKFAHITIVNLFEKYGISSNNLKSNLEKLVLSRFDSFVEGEKITTKEIDAIFERLVNVYVNELNYIEKLNKNIYDQTIKRLCRQNYIDKNTAEDIFQSSVVSYISHIVHNLDWAREKTDEEKKRYFLSIVRNKTTNEIKRLSREFSLNQELNYNISIKNGITPIIVEEIEVLDASVECIIKALDALYKEWLEDKKKYPKYISPIFHKKNEARNRLERLLFLYNRFRKKLLGFKIQENLVELSRILVKKNNYIKRDSLPKMILEGLIDISRKELTQELIETFKQHTSSAYRDIGNFKRSLMDKIERLCDG